MQGFFRGNGDIFPRLYKKYKTDESKKTFYFFASEVAQKNKKKKRWL